MKETIKTSRTVGYLEKIFRQLNTDFFCNELDVPVITIQNTPRVYGHVTCARVWRCKDTDCFELNIGAGTLSRPIENVVSTMLHEMVHIYNLMHGIQDCSRGNTYHNKRFKEKAESVGLVIAYDPRIGWSLTSPSERLIDYVIDQGWSDILMNRGVSLFSNLNPGGGTSSGGTSSGSTSSGRKPSSTRKYQCRCCGMSVRATKDVRIICADCGKLLEKV